MDTVLQNADWIGDVAVTLEFQVGSRILKNFLYLVQMLTWKRFVQLFSWKICLVQGQRSNSEFRERKLD